MKRPGIRAGGRAALGRLSFDSAGGRVFGLACLLACAALSACTGSNPRDQRYGQDSGADFDAPAATGGAGGSANGGAGGDTTAGTGGATDTGGAGGGAGTTGAGGAAGNGNGGSGGNGGVTGQAGAAGGNGGGAGQAGASGGNAGNGGATAQATFQNDWTAGRRTTKMLLTQV